MINQIKEKSFLGNLTHIKRYSGLELIKSESVSDHVSKMNCLAFSIVPEINKRISEYNKLGKFIKYINLKDIIYRISVHDLDETITFDFPRPIKYHNPEITKAFYNTTQLILKEHHLDQNFIDDINNAKEYNSREGYLVALFDTLQSGLKMQQEVDLGNKRFKLEIKNIIKLIEEKLSDINNFNYDEIFNESMKEILNEYLVEFKGYT